MLSEVWSSSHACCDFSESRSAWRGARSFSIAMMSPSFWARRQQRLDLADAAFGGADPGVVVDHLGRDVLGLAALLLDVAEGAEGGHRLVEVVAGTRRVRVLLDASAGSSLVVCSSADDPPHDVTRRIDLRRAARRHLPLCSVTSPVEMTACDGAGVAAPSPACRAAGAAWRRRRTRTARRPAGRPPAPESRPSRRGRPPRPRGGEQERRREHADQDRAAGDGQHGPLLRHGRCDAGGARIGSVGRCATLATCQTQPQPVVAVVGGGVSGLAAAHAVRQDRPDARVIVLEASPRVGGSLRSAEVGGVVVDVGAEAMLNRRPEAVDLARDGRPRRGPGAPGHHLGAPVDPRRGCARCRAR